MRAFDGLTAFYGDLHSHCGISYGHGSLDDAFRNGREQLDFCSVTGHALWPDMPAADPQTQYLIDYHEEGFARLAREWPAVQETTEAYHRDGEFVTFLSFEMHSCADGDHTVVYNGARGDILDVGGVAELRRRLQELDGEGVQAIAFPHHIAYRRGHRGVNWDAYEETHSPVVEIVSMHGCSEGDEGPRPFMHSMGPSDHESTLRHGMTLGHHFGLIGSTDHHSAHPGSYGHGRTGVWASELTREGIWEALCARRTFALTGDRIALQFGVNGHPMGARIGPSGQRTIEFEATGGGPIDGVDVVKNGRLLRRFSPADYVQPAVGDTVHAKLCLELGWGERKRRTDWEVELGISAGRVLAVEPRFRGLEIVAPTELEEWAPSSHRLSRWERAGERAVRFTTVTFGNPTNRTPATQAMCLEVDAPTAASVVACINGERVVVPIHRLVAGARADRIGPIGSAWYRFHRAPAWWEMDWRGRVVDREEPVPGDWYYVRVRQTTDQWAWASPVRVG